MEDMVRMRRGTTRSLRMMSVALFAAMALLGMLVLSGCGATTETTTDTPVESQPAETGGGAPSATTPTTDVTELVVEDLVVGTGAEAVVGKTVSVNYTGWLTNGDKFDSSFDAGQPFGFVLGQKEVIDGWDQGVVGMKVGGKRKLTIPPDLAYGDQGAGGGVIPPNATLVFEVELLSVE